MEKKKILFLSAEDKRRIAMNRTYEERFRLLMRLIRLGKMMSNAKIIYPDKSI